MEPTFFPSLGLTSYDDVGNPITITSNTQEVTETADTVSIVVTLPEPSEVTEIVVGGSGFTFSVTVAPDATTATEGVSDQAGNALGEPDTPFELPPGTTAKVVTITLTKDADAAEMTFTLQTLKICAKGTTVSPPGTTVSPPGTTVSPPGTTVSPPGTTVSPPGTTVSPPGTTVSPPGTTVSPPGTTVSPPGTTLSPPGTTVSPPGTTVSPPGTTVSPPGTTVSPPGTTVSPPGTTISPPGTTVSPPGTTVSPPGTTVSPPGTTVSPPGTTVSPPGTTVSPPGTTVSPPGTTVSPPGTTVSPPGTTVSPPGTTVSPPGTTVSPPGTTVSPPGTTVSPPGTTVSPPGTTVSPPGTTVSPPGTTVSPPGTTVSPPGTTVSPPGTTVSPPGTTISPPGTTVSPPGTTTTPPFSTPPPTATTVTTAAPCELVDQMDSPQVSFVTLTQSLPNGTSSEIAPRTTYTGGIVTIAIVLSQEADLGEVIISGDFTGTVAVSASESSATNPAVDQDSNSVLKPDIPFVFPVGAKAKIVFVTLNPTSPGGGVVFNVQTLTACLNLTAATTAPTTVVTASTTPCEPQYGPWEDWGACTPCGQGTRKRVRECDSCCSQTSLPEEDTEECTTCQCRVSIAEVQRELGFITDILGSMDPNSTSPSDLVVVGDQSYISSGTYVYGYCHQCYCDDAGNMQCNKTSDCACPTAWAEWGPCSADCGQGVQTRRLEPVPGMPQNCSDVEEEEPCTSGPCTTLPPECWSAWGDWTPPCPANNCEARQQTRRRDCSSNCTCSTSYQTEVQNCPTNDCVTTPICDDPERALVNCTVKCERSCLARRPGYVCTEADDCQIECGCAEGFYMQNNECVKEEDCNCYDPLTNKEYPPNYTEYKNDSCQLCTCASADGIYRCDDMDDCCLWTSWSPWTDCSARCDNGTRTRSRNSTNAGCNQASQDEEEPCQGPCQCYISETGEVFEEGDVYRENCTVCLCQKGNFSCNPDADAVIDGQWSAWSQWSQCNMDCRDFTRTRSRQCNSPAPECGGKDCVGNPEETAPCSDMPCCIFTWSEWSPCSITCYNEGEARGTTTRTPEYVNASEASACSQQDESKPCGDPCVCDIDPWSEWTPCTVTCGKGERTRSRTVPDMAACTDTLSEEVGECYMGDCECTNLTTWTNHSRCQRVCNQDVPPDCATYMEPGCICKEPYVRRGDKCVNETECNVCIINGTTYGPGEKFKTDQCTECECIDGKPSCYTETCETMENCNEDTHRIVYNPDKCCKYECVPKKCQPTVVTEKVTFGNCVSVANITYQVCRGDCGPSTASVDFGNMSIETTCKCCTPIAGAAKGYLFNCEGTMTTQYLPTIEDCKCNECVSTSSG